MNSDKHTINPPIGCRPDGSRYPFIVATTTGQTMGGHETQEAAASAAKMYQEQPRKNKFDFVVKQQ